MTAQGSVGQVVDAAVTLGHIREAHARIAARIHRTPVFTSMSLDEIAGAQLFFKCENLQKTGSFKIRGATNAVFSLSDEEAKHGSGGAVIRKSRGGDGAGSALARSSGVHRDAVEFVAGEKRGSAILRRADYGVRAEYRVAGGGGGGGGAPNRRSPGASL